MGEKDTPGKGPETADSKLNEAWQKIFNGFAGFSKSSHVANRRVDVGLDNHLLFHNPNLKNHHIIISTAETTEDGKPSLLILNRKCNGKRVQRQIVEADWTEQEPEIIEDIRTVFDEELALPFEEVATCAAKLIEEIIEFEGSFRRDPGWDSEEDPSLESPFDRFSRPPQRLN
jgi:hypothetical protein